MSHAADPRESDVIAIAEHSCEGEVLDGAVFDELLDSLARPTAVAALYRKFIGNAAAFIGELLVQEREARVDTMHTLRGSAAMMGAQRMAKRAAHWEVYLQSPSVPVVQAIQELEAELVAFRSTAAARLLALGTALES